MSIWFCDVGKFFQHGLEITAFVGTEGSGHVLPNSESWVYSIGCFPHFFDDADGFCEQSASFSCETFAKTGNRKILTRASESDAVNRLDLVSVDLRDVT